MPMGGKEVVAVAFGNRTGELADDEARGAAATN